MGIYILLNNKQRFLVVVSHTSRSDLSHTRSVPYPTIFEQPKKTEQFPNRYSSYNLILSAQRSIESSYDLGFPKKPREVFDVNVQDHPIGHFTRLCI